MSEGRCCFCLEYKSLCRAHIIPKGVANLMVEKSESLCMIKEGVGEIPNRYHKGLWDSAILCQNCDSELGRYDRYLVDFLKKDFSQYFNGEFYDIPNTEYSYERLKLACVASLWRASISKLEYYRNVCLGEKYEELCRRFLNREIKDIPEVRMCLLELSHPNPRLAKEITNLLSGFGRKGYYSLICGGYKIMLRVSNQPFDVDLRKIQLNSERLIIVKYPLEKTLEYERIVLHKK